MPENSSCSGASSCSKASCEGCSHNSQNPQSMLEAMNAYSNIKHVIGVVSGKGGVGKSFVTSSWRYRWRKPDIKWEFWMPILPTVHSKDVWSTRSAGR